MDARANRSLAMLTLGDLAGGFAEYETKTDRVFPMFRLTRVS